MQVQVATCSSLDWHHRPLSHRLVDCRRHNVLHGFSMQKTWRNFIVNHLWWSGSAAETLFPGTEKRLPVVFHVQLLINHSLRFFFILKFEWIIQREPINLQCASVVLGTELSLCNPFDFSAQNLCICGSRVLWSRRWHKSYEVNRFKESGQQTSVLDCFPRHTRTALTYSVFVQTQLPCLLLFPKIVIMTSRCFVCSFAEFRTSGWYDE